MNYVQEAKEESGRSGLGQWVYAKAPVTVNTLHDLMLFQLSQFLYLVQSYNSEKGQVQIQVAGKYRFSKQD